MKKKKKQIIELSDKEREDDREEEKDSSNAKEDEFKLIRIKNDIQNLDGRFAGSENYRILFLPMLYWKIN